MTQSGNLLLSIFTVLVTLTLAYGLSTTNNSLFQKTDYETHKDIPVRLILDERSRSRYNLRLNNIDDDLDIQHTPVVFWHGMGDTAYGSINIIRLALQREYPNISVLSIQIGSNVMEDELGGYFGNVNDQVELACQQVLANEVIREYGSFNAVGFSQGCQFLRGLIQRCPLRENGIQVKNYISMGGQHQGIFGLPSCLNNMFCNHIRSMLTNFAYDNDVQRSLVQAEYWHDPNREQAYRKKSAYLADINNENYINEKYRENLLSLENIVLVQFLKDHVVVPRESSLFGFYAPGQTDRKITLEESSLYLEDRLGLRELNEQGRLHKLGVEGDHMQFKVSWFMSNIASVYLSE